MSSASRQSWICLKNIQNMSIIFFLTQMIFKVNNLVIRRFNFGILAEFFSGRWSVLLRWGLSQHRFLCSLNLFWQVRFSIDSKFHLIWGLIVSYLTISGVSLKLNFDHKLAFELISDLDGKLDKNDISLYYENLEKWGGCGVVAAKK